MLASIVFKLRAQNKASIPDFHGRKLHAAFFNILSSYDEELAEAVHSNSGAKTFSLSQLQPLKAVKKMKLDFWSIKPGDEFFWRINLLTDELFYAVMSVDEGAVLRLENLELILEKKICDGSHDTGVLETEEILVADALEHAPVVKNLELNFTAPTTFRREKDDYPFPLPELIFGSLALRWSDLGLYPNIDVAWVKEIAERLLPVSWQGSSKKVYFAGDRGAITFQGKMEYSLKNLTEEEKSVILIMASFANFAGAGRMTSQGFGQMNINFK